jgi:hypothetical protein
MMRKLLIFSNASPCSIILRRRPSSSFSCIYFSPPSVPPFLGSDTVSSEKLRPSSDFRLRLTSARQVGGTSRPSSDYCRHGKRKVPLLSPVQLRGLSHFDVQRSAFAFLAPLPGASPDPRRTLTVDKGFIYGEGPARVRRGSGVGPGRMRCESAVE